MVLGVRFFWSELRIGDHDGRSASPLARAASDVHGSLKAMLGVATAALLLARAFSVISLKKKRTLVLGPVCAPAGASPSTSMHAKSRERPHGKHRTIF